MSASQLTAEEDRWTEEFVAACKEKGFALKSRFEAAKYAIVSKGNIDRAIKRIANMHKIDAEMGLSNYDGDECIQWMDDKQPGMILGVFTDMQDRPVSFFDYASFHPSTCSSPEDWGRLFKGFLTLMELFNATLDDVRRGCHFCASLKGFGWNNFSLEMEKKAACLYQDGYPIKIKQMSMIEPPTIFSIIIKLCRVFLSKKLMDRIVVINSSDIAKLVKPDQTPSDKFGGTASKNISEWIKHRRGLVNESISALEPAKKVVHM